MLWWLCSEALEPLLPGAQKIFSNTETGNATNTKFITSLIYSFLTGFWKILCFYHLSFLKYVQPLLCLKFPRQLGKAESLLIIFGREII